MRLLLRLGLLVAIIGTGSTAAMASSKEDSTQRPSETRLMGARLGPIPKQMADRLGLDPRFGVVVLEVDRRGPFAKAGVLASDVILGAGRSRVLSGPRSLRRLLVKSGEEGLSLQILRGGAPIDIHLDPGPKLRPPTRSADKAGRGEPRSLPRIGASVVNTQRAGALVRTVDRGLVPSLLRPSDIILGVGDKLVRNKEELIRLIDEAPEAEPVVLRISRRGRIRIVGIHLGDMATDEATVEQPTAQAESPDSSS